jgi:hypothetical protein
MIKKILLLMLSIGYVYAADPLVEVPKEIQIHFKRIDWQSGHAPVNDASTWEEKYPERMGQIDKFEIKWCRSFHKITSYYKNKDGTSTIWFDLGKVTMKPIDTANEIYDVSFTGTGLPSCQFRTNTLKNK